MDIIGSLTKSYHRNQYILTIQDDLTKYTLAIPIPQHGTNTIAKEFIEKFICFHDLPQSIVTGQGADFTGKVFIACCDLLKIEKLHTTAYRPQVNGAPERSHRTLTEYSRHYIDKNLQDSYDNVPFAMFVYNITIVKLPDKLLYGRPAEVPHLFYENQQSLVQLRRLLFEIKAKTYLIN